MMGVTHRSAEESRRRGVATAGGGVAHHFAGKVPTRRGDYSGRSRLAPVPVSSPVAESASLSLWLSGRAAPSANRPKQGLVVEFLAAPRRAEQQRAATHVTATDEFHRIQQPLTQDADKHIGILVARHAAEQDKLRLLQLRKAGDILFQR